MTLATAINAIAAPAAADAMPMPTALEVRRRPRSATCCGTAPTG
ncbi:MAG TPA: hypothetical protein RMH99_19365 [Sandaracinaceae bacterium LLY-WYZ-13_1]|nr:hypothetical protein [Sandaracinaceae bacterium LLY-WYZ-13_1]